MEIILLKDIDRLGYKHDLVDVKPGYGRNFLIPTGQAVIANDSNRAKLDKILEEQESKEAARVEEYKALADKINDQTLKIGVKTGTSGKIFGSVTNVQIAAALKDQMDVDVERRKIALSDEIKEMGDYTATVIFYKEIQAVVKLDLIKE